MAIPSNPKFGSSFNAAAFRSAIKSTLEMAAPNAVADKAYFMWKESRVFDTSVPRDPSGKPYNISAEVASINTPEDVQVNVAIEFSNGSAYGTAIGEINNAKVIITVLDEDYDLIKGASKVRLGTNQYEIDFWAPPIGLFGVDIHTAYAHATDET